MHHHAPARARADDDAEDHGRAGARAVAGFGQRKTIRVVREAHLPPHGLFEILLEGMADQPHGVGVLHQPGRRRDSARHPDPHGAVRTGIPFKCRDHPDQGPDGAVVVVPWRRTPVAGDHLPGVVERDALDFRSPEIDPDAHRDAP